MWSKYLVPKPKDWGSHIDVVGFFFEDNNTNNNINNKNKDNNENKENKENSEEQNNNNNQTKMEFIHPSLPEPLKDYLHKGPKPIFVGFGSMIIENIEKIVEVLLFHKIIFIYNFIHFFFLLLDFY